jgi:hypothetical protein
MKKIILDETTQKELILAGLAQSQLLADVVDKIGAMIYSRKASKTYATVLLLS